MDYVVESWNLKSLHMRDTEGPESEKEMGNGCRAQSNVEPGAKECRQPLEVEKCKEMNYSQRGCSPATHFILPTSRSERK